MEPILAGITLGIICYGVAAHARRCKCVSCKSRPWTQRARNDWSSLLEWRELDKRTYAEERKDSKKFRKQEKKWIKEALKKWRKK